MNNLKVRLDRRQVKQERPKRISGIARTHKIIRAEKSKELQFIQLCSQIRLEEYKQARAEDQRNDRRSKRQK